MKTLSDLISLVEGVTKSELKALIAKFKKEDEFYKFKKTPNDFKGSCDGTSRDLVLFLKTKGVSSKMIMGTGLQSELGKNASDGWVEFVGGDSANLAYLGHVVVIVGNTVLDITGIQFGKKYDSEIYSLSKFKRLWKKVKPFTL